MIKLIKYIFTAGLIFAIIWLGILRRSHQTATDTDKIRFISLAWQEQTIDANKSLVAEWNATHPEMPVEYIHGTWNSKHDYLITSFETSEVPDIFHYESAVIIDFAIRGFLADLKPFIEEEMANDILDVAWASVTRPNGEIVGIPFLLESFIGLYNAQLFENAGIAPPTLGSPWTWEEMKIAAKKLTRDLDGDGNIDQWGVAMGLRNSANLIMNHSIGFGGSFFKKEHDKFAVFVRQPEKQLLNTIINLLYVDCSMAPSSIGKSSTGMIPGFLSGKYAMIIGIGAWGRQQIVENAPRDFRWGVMPPLKALTQNIGINTQTLSIPEKSKRKQQAMAFIQFMLNRPNMAILAQSDWMLPTRKSCLNTPTFLTSENGWNIVTESVKFISTGSWLGAPGYVEWKTRVANPVLQELFANRLSLNEAAKRIELESNLVLSRYQMRGESW